MPPNFLFVGGDPSVDLVNTRMHRAHPGGGDDLLSSAEDARRWFLRAQLISEDEAQRLDPDAALTSARRLRAALDAVLRPIARAQPDDAATERGLATLNAVLDQGRERVQIIRADARFTRSSTLDVLGPLDPSVRVARRAADLLHRLDAARLKECENPECDLLFYDESRNNSRRWCSMQGCGNVQKQARFRQTTRSRTPRP